MMVRKNFAGFIAAASATLAIVTASPAMASCNISTTPLNFGPYDGRHPSPAFAYGVIHVSCLKGEGAIIAINAGVNPAGHSRRMRSQNDQLDYELYQPVSPANPTTGSPIGGVPWGASAHTVFILPKATTNRPFAVHVYGLIPVGQDIYVGQYTDVVTVSIRSDIGGTSTASLPIRAGVGYSSKAKPPAK